MTDRPQRKAVVPLLNPAASLPAEWAENFRRIYAGALADHRSIQAGAGVYAARVVAPLIVTDDGIALDWTDPRVFQVLSDLVAARLGDDLGQVKVDDGDEADFLENQLVDYTGDETNWIGVDILKPAAHEPLQARIDRLKIINLASRTGDEDSIELAIHYKGTNTITTTLSGADWRRKLLRIWARAGDTLSQLLAIGNPSSGTCALPWPTPLLANLANGSLIASPLADGLAPNTGFDPMRVYLWADPADGGKLKVQIVHPFPCDYEGQWAAGVAYAQGDVVLHNGDYYQSDQNGNAGHEPPAAGWWTAYDMREFWFHARIDVMGTVPENAGDYTNTGSAAG